jgi:uncharacterized ferritin-like protein (DUF455 family)
MKRLIKHDELARDSRFKRVKNRGTLLQNLPNNVETLARAFEAAGPAIRKRVEGTELERAYDEMGPGFQFLSNLAPADKDSPAFQLQLRMRIHGIFVGELQAMEAAGRTLWDFPDAPWEFKMNMARQTWDEARHVQIYEKLMDHVGCKTGAYPESTFLFEASCADDPAMRVAGVNRCLEGLACDVFRDLIELAKRIDDPIMEQAVDFVLADELTHVRFGSDWVKQFVKSDPERGKAVKEYQREVETSFAFGGERKLARDVRREAGFTEEEMDEIESLGGKGPKRETIRKAAELVRDRHIARKSGETVAPL